MPPVLSDVMTGVNRSRQGYRSHPTHSIALDTRQYGRFWYSLCCYPSTAVGRTPRKYPRVGESATGPSRCAQPLRPYYRKRLNLHGQERDVGLYHIHNINTYDSRLKTRMLRFHGVANKKFEQTVRQFIGRHIWSLHSNWFSHLHWLNR